jgi:hypothetical protein
MFCMRFLVVFLCLFQLEVAAQKIAYSEPSSDFVRNTNFEVIGKVGANYLVYMNFRTKHELVVFDNAMKEINRVQMTYMPDRVINVDLLTVKDSAYLFYQYQKKSIVYCQYVKFDQLGKTSYEPVFVDTALVKSSTDNKIFNVLFSDDKQKICVFKLLNQKDRKYVFSTNVFTQQMLLLKSSRFDFPMQEKNDFVTSFLLDNDGNLIFGKFVRTGSGEGDNISKFALCIKPLQIDSAEVYWLTPDTKIFLDDIKIRIDNYNKRYLMTSLYSDKKRNNIDGVYTMVFDRKEGKQINAAATKFNDELRNDAKGEATTKTAFNDFFVQNMIVKKDGGFIVNMESNYQQSRGNAFNRWDYYTGNPYNSTFSDLDYYTFGNNNMAGFRPGNVNSVRYAADNIVVLSFDKDAKLLWSNTLRKSQWQDDGDYVISYSILNTGEALHYLYNQQERSITLMSSQSITPEGKVIRNPTFKNLDKGYEFMPRYAKQVGGRSVLIPCSFRQNLCFAKLDLQ